MRKDKIVLDRETWDELCEHKRELLNDYRNEVVENKKLQNENGHLKALFDKEDDTQVIKYNGKLYRITSITNYVEAGVEETLDFTATPVREVG
jgi:cell shape-determining protein MreC